MVNSKIFRAYDIRGIYPSEINQETAYLIGRAFVKFLIKEAKNKIKKLKIVVGRDNRFSSNILFKNLIKGILQEGGNVLDLGLCSTPRFYFSTIFAKADGGIQITASHNPPQYNGFKLTKEKAIPISQESGLYEIQKIIEKGNFKSLTKKAGTIQKKDFLKNYIDFNFKLAKIENLKKFKCYKVVVDTANAVSGIDIKALFKRLPCRFFHLFSKLDGTFPNHNPDPIIEENLRFLFKEIKKKKADLGVAFDGDGDRIIFVDEKGKIIRGDFITALIAQELLKENEGQKILFEVRSSKVVKETILKNKGIPILGKAGHSLIKERMRKEDILFAGELSGHYFFKEIGFFEGSLLVLLMVLKIMEREKKPISQIIEPFKIYFQSGEINFQIKEKERKLKEIEKYFSKKAKNVLKIDGLTMEFSDWWFNLRPSNTEDLLRLNIEAATKKILEEKKKEIINLLK